MKNQTNRRISRLAVGAAFAMAFSGLAQAVPTVTLVPSGTQFRESGSLTVQVVVSNVLSADDVITFHDIYLAYSPGVLNLQTLTWGDAMQATTAPSPRETITSRYASNGAFIPSSVPADLAAPATSVTSKAGVDAGRDFYEGSLRLQETALVGTGGNSADDIYTTRFSGGRSATLFTVVFNVLADQIATSAIVLLDDRNFTGTQDFDWKTGQNLTVTDVNVVNTEIAAPTPAPLALMAAGLLGFGASRRIKR